MASNQRLVRSKAHLGDYLLPPLISKDVKMYLRKKRAAFLQLLFLAGCFGTAWMLWPQEGIYSLSANSARHLFTVLGIGQLAMVALFAPAFTSPAFTMEKERNTFDLLYGTLMSPFAIVWGKMAGALTFLLLVILSSVPVASICLVLGGVDRSAVLWFYVILFLTALQFGMIGLTVSALSSKTYLSVIFTYIVIGVLGVLVVIPPMMFISRVGTNLREVLHQLQSLSPFVAMASIVQPDLLRTSTSMTDVPDAYRLFIQASLVMTAGMAAFLFYYLRRCPSPKPRRQQVIDEAFTERMGKWPFYLVNPRGHRKMMGPLFNPVFIKELRTMIFGRIVYLLRGIYICVFVSLVLVLLAAFSTYMHTPRIIAVFTVSFQMVLMLLVAPIFSAPLISSEIESGRFDLLRLTKLSSIKIVSGKFQSVVLPLTMLVIATLPPYLALGYIEPVLWPHIARTGVTLVATLLFVCSAGMFFSAMSRKTATSVAATYVLVVLTCVLSLVGLLAPASFSPAVLRRVFVVNPVVTMLAEVALPSLRDKYELWLPNLYFLLVSSVVLMVLATLRVRMLVRPR